MLTGDWAFVNALVVVCEDDVIRHEKPFLARTDAMQWAAWGHACTRRHRYDLTRVLMVAVTDLEVGSFYAVDADGEKFLISAGQCPESYGVREGDEWWSVVQCKLGEPQGGDSHWVTRALAEQALTLYTEGAAFPIRSWHPAMGRQEAVSCG